ncbi:hypothetical protein VIBHAR_06897 [Vibrio campbellii ATCC BAA-1116]|uniref:Uncharacterized protein n=1 Tax=Vibrio campbellii (strain ATCC BAA-1116) TaxID=2902295 RepID=A7N5K4_VIBC1|nr:hypothetical protein VIBHAR_06897 [Vibrio campbellii ATCC BAA-1116]
MPVLISSASLMIYSRESYSCDAGSNYSQHSLSIKSVSMMRLSLVVN